jgi:hypothetical protein
MYQVGTEPKIPEFEMFKTAHDSNYVSNVIGSYVGKWSIN